MWVKNRDRKTLSQATQVVRWFGKNSSKWGKIFMRRKRMRGSIVLPTYSISSSFVFISAAELVSPSRRRTLSPFGKSFHPCKSLAVQTIARCASFLESLKSVVDHCFSAPNQLSATSAKPTNSSNDISPFSPIISTIPIHTSNKYHSDPYIFSQKDSQ